jgi:hypothetical protein
LLLVDPFPVLEDETLEWVNSSGGDGMNDSSRLSMVRVGRLMRDRRFGCFVVRDKFRLKGGGGDITGDQSRKVTDASGGSVKDVGQSSTMVWIGARWEECVGVTTYCYELSK